MTNRKVFLAALVLLLAASTAVAQNYHFSAVAPSGQTLYYKINYNTTEVDVYVVAPTSSSNLSAHAYGTYALPTGNLVIPDSVEIPGEDTKSVVRVIDSYAFMHCEGLTSVVVPNTVRAIGNHAFYQCFGLTSVTLPDSLPGHPAWGVEIGMAAFCGCTSLTGSLTVPAGVTTLMTSVFQGTKITSLTLPQTLTTIDEYAFAYCSELKGTVDIPSSVTDIFGEAFHQCYKLLTINVPATVELHGDIPGIFYLVNNVATTATWDWNTNFYGGPRTVNGHIEEGLVYADATKQKVTGHDYSRTTYTLPGSVQEVGFCAFLWDQELESVSLPTGLQTIGSNAFNNCTALTSIALPEGLDTIDYYAFAYCTGLSDITLPASLSYLARKAFAGCSLDTLRMAGSVPPTYYRFDWNDEDTSLVDVAILVPCHAGYAYRTAEGWNGCNNIIDPCDGDLFTVIARADDPTMGSVEGGGMVNPGETATLTATAHEGYHFVQWQDGDTHNPRTITVTSDTTFIAHFAANDDPDDPDNPDDPDDPEGIDDVAHDGIRILAADGRIVVEGAEGREVSIHDMMGRRLHTTNHPLPTGVYMVRIGDRPARKVVVMQ